MLTELIESSVQTCCSKDPAEDCLTETKTDLLCCGDTCVAHTNCIDTRLEFSISNCVSDHTECHTAGETYAETFQDVAADEKRGSGSYRGAKETDCHDEHAEGVDLSVSRT